MSPPSPPPPNALRDDPEGAHAARQRLAPKNGLARLLAKSSKLKLASPKQKRSPTTDSDDPHEDLLRVQHDLPICLDGKALISQDDTLDKDKYQWAVLYENQRGITAFSIPYYSSLSLLPTDPAPFTLPDPSLDPSRHPPVSPTTYPLPDGNWRWVSRAWMIDMRSDTGQVQHDGFEYNWIFRKHHWKSHVGPMNIAGYVRRRRWIRLMVRPTPHRQHKGENGTSTSSPTTASTPHTHFLSPASTNPYRYSLSSSIPSLMTGISDVSANSSINGYVDPNEVWFGTNSDEDWDRCRRLMKHFGRDGRKLELWCLWLGFHHIDQAVYEGEKKQWTEDDEPMSSEPVASELLNDTVTMVPREFVVAVLEKYVCSCFVLSHYQAPALNP